MQCSSINSAFILHRKDTCRNSTRYININDLKNCHPLFHFYFTHQIIVCEYEIMRVKQVSLISCFFEFTTTHAFIKLQEQMGKQANSAPCHNRWKSLYHKTCGVVLELYMRSFTRVHNSAVIRDVPGMCKNTHISGIPPKDPMMNSRINYSVQHSLNYSKSCRHAFEWIINVRYSNQQPG